ncbi:MAG: TonB-dependent receptor plug domain-containing protein, partial [Bacteroidota bacterium]|nr:TonB-dependent receptor plug domain-containing protein [Bacteroidota bacterium]
MHVVGKAVLVGRFVLFMTLIVAHVQAFGQKVIVVDLNDVGLSGVLLQWTCLDGGEAQTFTLDEQGFLWPTPECKKARAIASAFGYVTDTLVLERPGDTMAELRLPLEPLRVGLSSAEVEEQSEEPLSFMNSLEAGGMYRGIKSAVMSPSAQLAVVGEVQPRNVFAGLPGANVWESDAAGLQLGIGVRGMSPNRSAHLSLRQNGHPIAADPLGYPESYYTPPMTMVEEVQWVSGASALQYGSQLGGMLNFVMRPVSLGKTPRARWTTSLTGYTPRKGTMRGYGHVFAEGSGGGPSAGFLVAVDHKAGSGWR